MNLFRSEADYSRSMPQGVKRKQAAEDDDSPALKKIYQGLLKLLECPVCLESMEPPVQQCTRGHLVCDKCRARLTACPVCRAGFSGMRNRAMEGVAELVRYPCRFGCSCEVRLRERAAHEAICPAHCHCWCPVPQCGACLLRRELLAHVQDQHRTLVILGHKHELWLYLNADWRFSYLVLAHGQVFHLRAEWDPRTWGLWMLVTYVGPSSEAKYTYQMVGEGCEGPQHSRQTPSSVECPGFCLDAFHLTVEQALSYLSHPSQTDQPLKMSLDILKNF